MPTQLIFQTTPGGAVVVVGETENLGNVDVSEYTRIRLVAGQRPGQIASAVITVILVDGNEPVAVLTTIQLWQQGSRTCVFEVPGTQLAFQASTTGGDLGSSVTVDLLVYAAP